MSINNKAIFEEKLNLLIGEVILANDYYELYIYLSNCRIDKRNILNLSPGFFQLVQNSFLYSTFIILTKIYEDRRSTQFSLLQFIKFSQENLDIFMKEYIVEYRCEGRPELTLREHKDELLITPGKIQKHLSFWEENKIIINNLISWRDKHFAHYDKHYTFDPDKLSQDFNLKVGDIRNLILHAMNILNDYSVGYNGVSNSAHHSNYRDIDNIFEILEKYKMAPSSL